VPQAVPPFRRLSVRFVAALSLVLVLMLSLGIGFMLDQERRWIMEEEQARAALLVRGLEASLQTLMVTGDGPLAREWLGRVKQEPGVVKAEVIRRDGTEAFRDLETIDKVNRFLDADQFHRNPLPSRTVDDIDLAAFQQALNNTPATLRDDVAQTLTYLFPVMRNDECLGCHGYEEAPVRGVLRVTTSLAAAEGRIAEAWRLSVIGGAVLLLMLGGAVYALVLKQVIAPVLEVVGATRRVAEGDLQTRLTLERNDEFGELETSFNRMVAHLEGTTVSRDFFDDIMTSLAEPLLVLAPDLHIRSANPATVQLLGLDEAVLVGAPVESLFDPSGSLKAEEMRALLKGQGMHGLEKRWRTGDGRIVPILFSFAPLSGQIGGFVCVAQDITERKKAEEKMELAGMVMDSAMEGIIITAPDGEIVTVNPAFTHVTGYTLDEVRGHNPNLLQSGRHTQEFYKGMWHGLLKEGYWQGEIWNRRKSGEVYPEWLSIRAVYNADGFLSHFVGIFSDITERKQFEEKLTYLATHDPMTTLPNRTLFNDRLEQAVLQAQRYHNLFALLFVDLDGFKQVNDSLGHDKGDLLLVEAAARMRRQVRSSDSVARLGGDEFTILLLDLNQAEDAERIAAKVVDALGQPYELDGTMVDFVGASIGVAIYPTHGSNVEAILKAADDAMYAAKGGGKGRYCLAEVVGGQKGEGQEG